MIRDNDGKIQGVRYDELAPMLLNSMQGQQPTFATESGKIAARATTPAALATPKSIQAARIASLEHQIAELNDFKQALCAALAELKSSQVAQR